MYQKHKDCYKGFVHLSRAWYGPSSLINTPYTDEVTFGYYHPEGGTTGEMSLRWYPLNSSLPSAKLECFEDSFDALSEFTDVISDLGYFDSKNIQPEFFCDLLKSCGFKDITPTKRS